MTDIWQPITLGRATLANRFVMAPMTRSRAQYDGTPGPLAAEYYAQRASVGLIVAEGTQPSDDGQGYLMTPGIYTEAHIAGWKTVTSAVHAKGGHIYIQLMHAGRMSHPDNTPHHRQGVAPSAIAPGTGMFTASGMQDIPTPRALSIEEIRQTVQDFRHAARCAIEAGADGVEIHGANAYLIQQFFAPSANTRTDDYGGSIENRARFAIEVATAIAEEIGADRTAIRFSPGTSLWGIDEGAEGPDLYRYLIGELDKLHLSYVHIMHQGNEQLLSDIRQLWTGRLILNRPGRPREDIGKDVAGGLADMEAYGQMILANPDFLARLKADPPEPKQDIPIGPSLPPLLDVAEKTLGKGQIGFILFLPNSVLFSRTDMSGPLLTREHVDFSPVDGHFLRHVLLSTPVTQTQQLMEGIHYARWTGTGLRWLYFLSGVMGAIMFASGAIIFLMKRRKVSGKRVMFRVAEGLTIGCIPGFLLATLAFFWANRLLPTSLPARHLAEVYCFFAVWGLSSIAGMLWSLLHRALPGWKIQLSALAFLGVLLTPLDFLTRPGASMMHVPTVFAAMDICALILGLASLQVVRRL